MNLDKIKLPKHLAIIMDGNGRWAQERGKKRSYGHQEGSKVLEVIAQYVRNCGIKYLSVYAFSTDNFKRSQEEVDFLMNLLIFYFNNKLQTVCKKNIKVVFSGRKDNLSKEVLKAMDNIQNKTINNQDCVLNICLNYGAQEEIVDAAKKIANDINSGVLKETDLTRDNFYQYLYQDLPPIDLLIRTGKERRLSNFMLYQSSYAELYFLDKYFPDLTEEDIDTAISYYANCHRRFGGVKTN